MLPLLLSNYCLRITGNISRIIQNMILELNSIANSVLALEYDILELENIVNVILVLDYFSE